jgi:hypothetical protein
MGDAAKKTFSHITAEFPPSLTVDDIARAAHEANRAYCLGLGDKSQPPWEDAPVWQRESAIAGVDFHLANPNASPSASHHNWCLDKFFAGWTFGPVKDPEAKQHPCLVPYEDLPVEQRTKDALFIAVVKALLPMLNRPTILRPADGPEAADAAS